MARTPKSIESAERRDYLALTPIQHDLVEYGAGKTIELTEAEAAPLIAVGAVTDKPTKAQLAAVLADQPDDVAGAGEGETAE